MRLRSPREKIFASFFFVLIMSAAYDAIAASMSCSFVGGNTGAISFGNAIDPTAAGPVYGTVTTQVQFQCTKANAITMTVTPVSGWQLISGTNTIAYTLGVNNLTIGPTAPTNLFIPSGAGASNMTQAQYANAPAATYANNGTGNSGAITVTISWTSPAGSISAQLPVGSVSGTVKNQCVVSGSPSVSWGTLDASAMGPYPATVSSPVLYCTKSDTVTILTDYGVNRSGTQYRLKSGSNYIKYNFAFTTPLTGAGGTTNIGDIGIGSLGINASISAGDIDLAPAGTYTDTVGLTINY